MLGRSGPLFRPFLRPFSNETRQNVYYFDEISSTMDKAKEILKTEANIHSVFSVIANCQTNGRGTQGRSWISIRGNLLMTVGFRMKDVPISLTLIPLRIGHMLCTAVEDVLRGNDSLSSVALKWPNDVLVENNKVCGVLIEVENDTLLVGVGCNLLMAPSVQKVGAESGRDATCLQEHLPTFESPSNLYSLRDQLASTILMKIEEWISLQDDCDERVIQECSERMSYTPQRLRLERIKNGNASGCTGIGDEVLPIRLNSDGTLQVLHTQTNKEMTLAADYLW